MKLYAESHLVRVRRYPELPDATLVLFDHGGDRGIALASDLSDERLGALLRWLTRTPTIIAPPGVMDALLLVGAEIRRALPAGIGILISTGGEHGAYATVGITTTAAAERLATLIERIYPY